jgi:protein-tyrosine phosphatase
MNWDEIRPDLVIGSCPYTVADLEHIRVETRASALLSLQHDECHAYLGIDRKALVCHGERRGLVMARQPIRDFDVADMRRHLGAAVSLLDSLLRAGHRVYVHCTAGTGRSPLTVLGYLALIESCTPAQALALIRSHRPGVCPSLEAYLGCRADLVERHQERIAGRAQEIWTRDPRIAQEEALVHAEREVLREVLRETRPAGRDG